MMLVGKYKIAALLLNLEKNEAARVLQSFTEEKMMAIAETMREISGMDIPKEEISRIYEDFKKSLRIRSGIFKPRPDQVEELFAASLGEGKTDDLFNELDQKIIPESPFKQLTRFPREILARILQDEHPQTIALALSQIESNRAAQVITQLEEDLRLDILTRIAKLKNPSKEILRNIAIKLAEKAKDLMVTESPDDAKERLQTVADVLNRVDKDTEKNVLSKISEKDSEMAEEIRELMFTFDDLLLVDKRAMQKILSGINVQVLALALKGAHKQVENFIMSNVSQRVKKLIQDEKEMLGPRTVEEVTGAQKEIVAIVRTLIENGEITISRSSEEELLV